ncbi:succinate dehydrogenase cytochrome b558 subunit [Planctomycetes bacterium K23_9]|uniref:succinate dehydrogenase cytochrome b558 subunit n=1 Tax=Stieleria marina TaxID=1930275 RepID=UPI0011A0D36A
MTDNTPETSFFLRNEFLIRRVHSLLGIVPLGLYMVVHLTTNASFLTGTETFQRAVYLIHSPGELLPVIEWALIFAPLVFHAAIGIWISKTGRDNSQQYKFTSNRRYMLQRVTGVVALVFLFFHILHLHGWFHAEFWIDGVRALGFANFRPYNAGSTLAMAMNGYIWPTFYLIGVLSCVYHLANGLWTAGITWGLWISPAGQGRASKICVAFGAILAVISLTAWWAAVAPGDKDIAEMKKVEDRMHKVALEAGFIADMPEKQWVIESEGESNSSDAKADDSAKSDDDGGEKEAENLELSSPDGSGL